MWLRTRPPSLTATKKTIWTRRLSLVSSRSLPTVGNVSWRAPATWSKTTVSSRTPTSSSARPASPVAVRARESATRKRASVTSTTSAVRFVFSFQLYHPICLSSFSVTNFMIPGRSIIFSLWLHKGPLLQSQRTHIIQRWQGEEPFLSHHAPITSKPTRKWFLLYVYNQVET